MKKIMDMLKGMVSKVLGNKEDIKEVAIDLEKPLIERSDLFEVATKKPNKGVLKECARRLLKVAKFFVISVMVICTITIIALFMAI
ncbi:MAG: hypothetical protein ACRCX2_09945 [Paraclostridium sp.]